MIIFQVVPMGILLQKWLRKKVHEIVINDWRVKVNDISETVGISIERLHNILRTHLDVKKLSVWLVSLLLTLYTRVYSEECLLQPYAATVMVFGHRFIAADSSQHTKYQKTFQIVSFKRRICSKGGNKHSFKGRSNRIFKEDIKDGKTLD